MTAVAAIAAVVSYTNLHDLAIAHDQSSLAAQMPPLSVDGLIVAASLVLMHEARAGRSAPAFALWCLAAGVAATVGGNVASVSGTGSWGRGDLRMAGGELHWRGGAWPGHRLARPPVSGGICSR